MAYFDMQTGNGVTIIHFFCASCQLILTFSSYPTALKMVASGSVNVKPLITHTYKLEESLQAFERAKTGEGGAIKVCVQFEEP